MAKTLALTLCLTLAGCATDCTSDWYAVGQNDGRIGADSQVERYAGSCSAIDRTRYAEGLQSGQAMRPRIAAF